MFFWDWELPGTELPPPQALAKSSVEPCTFPGDPSVRSFTGSEKSTDEEAPHLTPGDLTRRLRRPAALVRFNLLIRKIKHRLQGRAVPVHVLRWRGRHANGVGTTGKHSNAGSRVGLQRSKGVRSSLSKHDGSGRQAPQALLGGTATVILHSGSDYGIQPIGRSEASDRRRRNGTRC